MKYIIKKHYEATETNKNFAGEVHDWYEGKAGHILSKDKMPTEYFINEHGYTTKAAAKRGFNAAVKMAKWETDLGHWNVTVSLIEC